MIYLYDSLRGKKVEFVPIRDGEVKMYSCGPTVYNTPHIGNVRAALVADLWRRSFQFLGYEVKFVSNYTDVDDKMINKANEEGISIGELSERVVKLCEKSYQYLRVNEPDVRPYATTYVQEMIDFVVELMEKDFAYDIEGDGVYFRIDKFEEYGKLSKQNLEALNIGERIEENVGKENPRDFVLWKYKKENEPFWVDANGKLSDGRPGWHIECSVMIEETLGSPIDIHAGGEDLKFPHHECEIAQTEACKGHVLANYWIHNGMLNMSGEKMSKSLGNIKTVLDLVKLYDPLDIRYFLMSVHYRSPVDFTAKNINQAGNARTRLQNLWDRLSDLELDDSKHGSDVFEAKDLDQFMKDIKESLGDDLNVSKALAVYFEFVTRANEVLDKVNLDLNSIVCLKNFMRKLDEFFGVLRYEQVELDEAQRTLFEQRLEARSLKDFALSDELRDKLLELGVQVMDSKDGSTYRVIS